MPHLDMPTIYTKPHEKGSTVMIEREKQRDDQQKKHAAEKARHARSKKEQQEKREHPEEKETRSDTDPQSMKDKDHIKRIEEKTKKH